MPEPSPSAQPSESGPEQHLDFEVGNDGKRRRITVGDSFDELEQTLELYYPDPEMRERASRELLKAAVNKGLLRNEYLTVLARDDLDLSDAAIAEAFPGPVSEPAVDISDQAINQAFFSDKQPEGQGETNNG